MSVEIIQGDCMAVLPTLPERSVHCVITSPPYWGLRDYGVAGQLGLEPTPEAYVANMVAVFREVRRVLRDDGTVWLNLGDSYAGSGKGGNPDDAGSIGVSAKVNAVTNVSRRLTAAAGLAAKQLIGIPWRVAFALQADGWWLRSDIIWSKPNPMPESVTDRPTRAHEYVFLCSKSARYYYDADAIREVGEGYGRSERFRGSSYTNGRSFENGGKEPNATGGGAASHDGSGRNKRSVWEIATQPFPGAHFATFPEALVKPCILAGCPERCCAECGAPWERVTERTPNPRRVEGYTAHGQHAGTFRNDNGIGGAGSGALTPCFCTIGWRPTCQHDAGTVPAVALDPFAGSGTVGVVARLAGRRAILIELSEDYCAMMRERMRQKVLL